MNNDDIKSILEIEEINNKDVLYEDTESDDDELPFPYPPYNISWKVERMYVLTMLNELIQKVKDLESLVKK